MAEDGYRALELAKQIAAEKLKGLNDAIRRVQQAKAQSSTEKKSAAQATTR